VTTDPFYFSPAWRALRLLVLRRDRWRCVVCGAGVWARGAARVDHIKPRRTHPDLELVSDNCRTLCTLHDAQAHRERGPGRAPVVGRVERFTLRGVGADGWPIGT
jgi:5-methylcytosine-specific restriction endonuclease McrA